MARLLDSRKGERDEFNVMVLGAVLSMAYPLSFLLAQAPWHLMLIAALGGASTACIMAAYYSLFSHHVDRESFMGMLRHAAGKARRSCRLAALRGQAADHPVLLAMPETEYLHFALLEVL